MRPPLQSILHRLRPALHRASRAGWFWNDIVLPFLATRLAWVITAAYARGNYVSNPTYAERAETGFQFSRFFLIDIFSRWDTRFYLQIVQEGYIAPADPTVTYSTTAFFPLYPYIVKALGWLAAGWWMKRVPDSLYLATGILLSNICFLLAAVLLYRLATRHLPLGRETARRALGLLFVFPVGFVFSAFYTESLFLFLSLAAWIAALERRWHWAALLAALAAVTRVQGILVALAIFLLYAQFREWKPRALLHRETLPFLTIPALLGAHLFDLYLRTGSILAPFTAQEAWGLGRYDFFEGLGIQLGAPVFDIFKLDALLMLVFAACGAYLLWKWQVKAYGAYTLLLSLFPLLSGRVISGSRYVMVAFPAFLLLAQILRHRWAYDLVRAACFALQIVFFAGWANWYWID